MGFIEKRQVFLNFIISISCIIDVFIGIIINIISDKPFNLTNTNNIIIVSILVILVLIFIICNICINKYSAQVNAKMLQETFSKCGGYETAVNEMKACIKDGDKKRLKDIKKMIELVEK